MATIPLCRKKERGDGGEGEERDGSAIKIKEILFKKRQCVSSCKNIAQEILIKSY